MNELPITYVPKPILKQKAKKVTEFGPTLRQLAESMVATMRQNRGMGLAAPQVDQSQRLIVVEYEPDERGEKGIPLTVLVNPTITDTNKQTDWLDEGCLSIPTVEIPVERPTQVNVLAQDLDGNRVKIRAKNLYARILQHEIDHLDGMLMTERAYPELKDLAGKRIMFFGTPSLALPYLTALAATDAEIVGVVTETDKPAGRKQILTAPPVKTQAELLGLPVYQFETLKDEAIQQVIRDLTPDVAIVVAYGKIMPQAVLDIPTHGFLNVHFSLLPKFRGPSPHQTAILSGEKETGITIFKLDKGVDTGDILIQKRTVIEPDDHSLSLIEKLVPLGVAALLESLPGYLNGSRTLRPQSHHATSQTRLFSKEDGQIDWTQSVEVIDRQIRAMYPWPSAFTEVNDERLIIHAAHPEHNRLILDVVQPAGKKPMTFTEYLKANRENRLTFFQKTGKVKTD